MVPPWNIETAKSLERTILESYMLFARVRPKTIIVRTRFLLRAIGELIDAALALVPPDLSQRLKKPSLTVIEGRRAE